MRVEIMDTTLRDGEQTQGVSYTPLEKLHIAKLLLKDLRLTGLRWLQPAYQKVNLKP